MKNIKIKGMVLSLCLVMALASAGCSKTEEKTDDDVTTTTTEEEVDESDPSDETVASSETTDATEQPTMETFTASEMVSSSTYDQLYQQCEDNGLTVMPIEDGFYTGDVEVVDGFIAYGFGDSGSYSTFLDVDLPEGYEDIFESDEMQAIRDFLESGEIPEGYEDLFSDIDPADLEGFEGFDLEGFNLDGSDSDGSASHYIITGSGDGSFGSTMNTVVCLQFNSYEDALAYVSDDYSQIVVEETGDGCVIRGSVSESGVVSTVDGAISPDGLLYMNITTGY